MKVKIYHNPKCSTSLKVLEMIQNAGVDPEMIEYLKNPPSREELRNMIARAGLKVREAIREKEALYDELGLDNASLPDEALLDAMVEHPVLINRPFVVTSKDVRLCRPPEIVLEILPAHD